MVLLGLESRKYRIWLHRIDIARCIGIAIIVYSHTYDN